MGSTARRKMPFGASSFRRALSCVSRLAPGRRGRAEALRHRMNLLFACQGRLAAPKPRGEGGWHSPLGLSLAVLLLAFIAVDAQTPPRKRLLALGDTHTGYTHDSIGHALAVIDHLGRQSGVYDTYIRTD